MYADYLSSYIYLSAVISWIICLLSLGYRNVDRDKAAFDRLMGKAGRRQEYIGPIWAGILTALVHSVNTLCGYLLTFYSRGDVYWFGLISLIGILAAEVGIPVENNAPTSRKYLVFRGCAVATRLAVLVPFGYALGVPLFISALVAIWIDLASHGVLWLLDKIPNLGTLQRNR